MTTAPSYQEFHDDAPNQLPVRGYLHRAGDHWLILTHGAGANCESLLLVTMSEAFCRAGFTVLRCNLPFRQLRPTGPPPRGSAERDQQGLRSAIASAKRQGAHLVSLGGHSYGGRQASMLAATDPDAIHRLLLLSYPLHPPQRPEELRTAHFPQLKVPALFVHGTRDGFGSIDEMTQMLKLIPATTELLPIAGAGHELLTKRNSQQVCETILDTFAAFLR